MGRSEWALRITNLVGCAFYRIGHLFPKEVDLESNVAEEEDEEGDGDPDQVDDGTRGEAHRVPATGRLMFFCVGFL